MDRCRSRLKQLVVSVSGHYYWVKFYRLVNVFVAVGFIIKITCHGIYAAKRCGYGKK